MQHMLSCKEDLSDTVIIMNEFGTISIDGMLIDRDVKMVELVNGCICCTLQIDLRKQIETLVDQINPRWLIMEATGLADTVALIDIFAEYTEKALLASYRMAAVVDVQIWPMRHLLGPVFNGQLAHAGLILLNKIDTLDPEKVKSCLEEVASTYPRAAIEPTTYCRIDMDRLRGLKALNSRTEPGIGTHDPFHDSTKGWSSLSFSDERPLSEEKFKEFIRTRSAEVFRLKGVVRFPDRTSIINHVHGASEWIETASAGKTQLVVIGRVADLNGIAGELKSCIAG